MLASGSVSPGYQYPVNGGRKRVYRIPGIPCSATLLNLLSPLLTPILYEFGGP